MAAGAIFEAIPDPGPVAAIIHDFALGRVQDSRRNRDCDCYLWRLEALRMLWCGEGVYYFGGNQMAILFPRGLVKVNAMISVWIGPSVGVRGCYVPGGFRSQNSLGYSDFLCGVAPWREGGGRENAPQGTSETKTRVLPGGGRAILGEESSSFSPARGRFPGLRLDSSRIQMVKRYEQS